MGLRRLREENVILVCSESDCKENGCRKVCKRLKQELAERGLTDTIQVRRVGCLGDCKKGPNVLVYPSSEMYSGVRKRDVSRIVEDAASQLAGV